MIVTWIDFFFRKFRPDVSAISDSYPKVATIKLTNFHAALGLII